MKLTESEIEMFKALGNTGIGEQLANYYERLIDHVYDSRHWSTNDTKESAKQAAKVLEEGLLNKIRLQNKPRPQVVDHRL